jgi:hypothetical protein
MHQLSGLRVVIREFFCNSNISVEILDQNLEIAIQLENGKAALIQK